MTSTKTKPAKKSRRLRAQGLRGGLSVRSNLRAGSNGNEPGTLKE